jgi:hypothetical protein
LALALDVFLIEIERNKADQFEMQFRRWITYENRRFGVTPRALANAPIAESCGGLNSRATRSSDTHDDTHDEM